MYIYIHRLAASNRLADVRVVSGAAASNKNAPGRSRARKSGIATGKMAGDRLPPQPTTTSHPPTSRDAPVPRPQTHCPPTGGRPFYSRARPTTSGRRSPLSRCPSVCAYPSYTRAQLTRCRVVGRILYRCEEGHGSCYTTVQFA